MHLIEMKQGKDAVATAIYRPPFGPGFSEAEVLKAEKLEIYGSSFTDPGEDFTEFRLLDAAGQIIGTRRVSGF